MLGCLPLFLVLLLLAPLFLVLSYFNAITLSFHRLGLSTEGAMLLFAASLIGGMINIPISRRPMLVPAPRMSGLMRYFYPSYYPPPVPNVGITMPAFVPPLVAVASALAFAPPGQAPVAAYIGGTVGTLVGADLL